MRIQTSVPGPRGKTFSATVQEVGGSFPSGPPSGPTRGRPKDFPCARSTVPAPKKSRAGSGAATMLKALRPPDAQVPRGSGAASFAILSLARLAFPSCFRSPGLHRPDPKSSPESGAGGGLRPGSAILLASRRCPASILSAARATKRKEPRLTRVSFPPPFPDTHR